MNPPKNKIRIAMGQLLVEGGEPERNLDRACSLVREAAQAKADLILLPECLDLAWTHPSALTEAEPIPGPRSDRLVQLAKENNLYICAGLTEKERDKVFNSALLISPQGEIILKYRKINILKVAQPFYSIGNSLGVVETEFGTIGLNICSDNYLSSLPIGHTLARMGAQIILSPSSWTVDYSITERDNPYGDKWIKPYSILAKLYDLVIVSTTSVGVIVGGPYEGKKMVGCSLAVNKSGILVQGKFNEFSSQIICQDIEIPKRNLFGTELSDSITSQGYSFDFNIR